MNAVGGVGLEFGLKQEQSRPEVGKAEMIQ